MIEQKIDILSDEVLKNADAICFTSNGIVSKKTGKLVMGAGVAKAFTDRFPTIDCSAGFKVDDNGNICQRVSGYFNEHGNYSVVAFPTKSHWRNPSDIDLIKKSAVELMELIESNKWETVYLPRPGCNHGKLSWSDVKIEIESILDDRVIITSL